MLTGTTRGVGVTKLLNGSASSHWYPLQPWDGWHFGRLQNGLAAGTFGGTVMPDLLTFPEYLVDSCGGILFAVVK